MREDVLTTLADEATAVTGGCGATLAVWPRAGAETVLVASHPELGELVELEHFVGDGPGLHALRSEHPVSAPDLVHDPRWARLGHEALARGLRACVAASGRGPGATAVITVYGLRPGEPGEPAAPFVASLARQAAWLSTFAETRDQHEREVRQLRQTMEGRETIEQAKGMIMQALGVDAEQAFAELRRTSQNAHMKLRDVAERLIAREI